MLPNTNIWDYKRILLAVGGVIILMLSAYMIGVLVASPRERYGLLSVALVLGFFGAFLILRRPLFGLALMFFLIPLGPVTRIIGGERAITLALGVLLIGIFGSKVLILHEKIKFDRVSQLACAFAGWAVITSLWAYSMEVSLQYALRLIQMIAIYVLFLNYCRTERHLNIFTLSFAAGAMVAAVWALLKGHFYAGRLVLSSGFNPNFFSAMVSTGMILMCYHFYRSKNKLLQVLLALSIPAVGVSIILSQSRGVWIAISASLLISILLATKNRKLIRNVAISITLVIGLLVSGYYTGIINQDIVERFNTLFSEDKRVSTAGRTDIWKVGLVIIKDTLPLGVGFSNFPIAYRKYVRTVNVDFIKQRKGDPHNTFLGILAETGLVGFIIFISIFIYLFKRIWYIADQVTRLMLMWLLGSLMFISLSGTNHLTPWFWVVLLFVALKIKLENQRGRESLHKIIY